MRAVVGQRSRCTLSIGSVADSESEGSRCVKAGVTAHELHISSRQASRDGDSTYRPRPITESTAMPVPTIFIFGGGIAGMTAAHELIERGFGVTLYERDQDFESREEGFPCAVGGVARSQWARVAPPVIEWEQPEPLPIAWPADKLFDRKSRQIEFERGSSRLSDKARATLDRFVADLSEHKPIGPVWIRSEYHEGVETQTVAKRRRSVVLKYLKKRWRPPASQGSFEVIADGAKLFLPLSVCKPGDKSIVTLQLEEYIVPGEHGFRYFPSFYRHVFDTMQRIPLPVESGSDGREYEHARLSVLDNLVPTRTMWLAAAKGRGESIEFPRKRPGSLREAVDRIKDALGKLGYTAADIAQLSLKLFKYMTSSPARREEYEQISWWDFIEGDQLSPRARQHMDTAPEILGAMVARQSDARTLGSVTVQLLLDQIEARERTDATLVGPTTLAWFRPWRKYLAYRGVQFRCGTLIDFEVEGDKVLPVVKLPDGKRETPETGYKDYYILAVPLPELVDVGGGGLAGKFLDAVSGLSGDVSDFTKIQEMNVPNWNDREQGREGPLQHLVGIQYYLRVDDRGAAPGHTLYVDSPWRLSSISQPQFWSINELPGYFFPEYATTNNIYQGILSVDIGNLRDGGDGYKPAWECTRQEIAEETYRQIRAVHRPGERDRLLPPWFCHIDQSLIFGEISKKPEKNTSPYLVNLPEQWACRPGTPGKYQLQTGRWVLAGTHMKTYTRLTTMEAANESARHAVNAILDDIVDLPNERGELQYREWTPDRCLVVDPEKNEHPDLRWFQEVDEKLHEIGLDHCLDILEINELNQRIWLRIMNQKKG